MNTLELPDKKATSLRKKDKLDQSDSDDPIVWGFVIPLVPEPDIHQEVDQLNEQYSLSNLLKKFKKSN